MKRIQVIAIILVVLLAATVIPAAAMARPINPAPKNVKSTVGSVSTVGSASIVGSAYTISTATAPLYPNRDQIYTHSGYLRLSGTAIAGEIEVWWKYPATDNVWHYWKNVPATAWGGYSFTDSETNQVRVDYCFVYRDAYALKTVWVGWTGITALATTYDPGYNVQYTIYGTATDAYGTGLPGYNVKLYYQTWTPARGYAEWLYWKTVPIGANGLWSTTTRDTTWDRYIAVFDGNPRGGSDWYFKSYGTSAWIDGT